MFLTGNIESILFASITMEMKCSTPKGFQAPPLRWPISPIKNQDTPTIPARTEGISHCLYESFTSIQQWPMDPQMSVISQWPINLQSTIVLSGTNDIYNHLAFTNFTPSTVFYKNESKQHPPQKRKRSPTPQTDSSDELPSPVFHTLPHLRRKITDSPSKCPRQLFHK